MEKQLTINDLSNEKHKKILNNIIYLTNNISSAGKGVFGNLLKEKFTKERKKEIHKLVKILNSINV